MKTAEEWIREADEANIGAWVYEPDKWRIEFTRRIQADALRYAADICNGTAMSYAAGDTSVLGLLTKTLYREANKLTPTQGG